MELEFDKEIDAILRKGRRDTGVSPALDAPHLDADAVAAFVDNALPSKVKLLYVQHLADCGSCRGMLVHSIAANEAVPSPSSEAVGSYQAPAETWWSRIFRTPNLALGMGALVLAFSGILGFLALSNREERNATISQANTAPVRDQAPASTAAADDNSRTAGNSAVTSNVPALPAETRPNSASNSSAAARAAAKPAGEPPEAVRSGIARTEADQPFAVDGSVAAGAAPPIAAAAPPPSLPEPRPVEDEKVRDREAKEKAEDAAVNDAIRTEERVAIARKRAADDFGGSRGNTNLKRAPAGPSRNSGQVQQMPNVMLEAVPVRTVAGKTFSLRNGIWYDAAYRNQGTREIKRGSEKYKALDEGLRETAEQFSGTVVIVWAGKAYKIY